MDTNHCFSYIRHPVTWMASIVNDQVETTDCGRGQYNGKSLLVLLLKLIPQTLCAEGESRLQLFL